VEISTVREKGQIRIRGFMGSMSFGEKFFRFQNQQWKSQKQENTEKNCLSVEMQLRTHCFTFNNIPPPPPLLHPINTWRIVWNKK